MRIITANLLEGCDNARCMTTCFCHDSSEFDISEVLREFCEVVKKSGDSCCPDCRACLHASLERKQTNAFSLENYCRS